MHYTALLTLNRIHKGNLSINGFWYHTGATVQVWDSVWSDTDVQGDHLRILKSCDRQGVLGKNQSCSKLPEMERKLIKNVFRRF